MFQFNFFSDEASSSNLNINSECKEDDGDKQWFEAKEIYPRKDVLDQQLDNINCMNIFRCGEDISIKYLTTDAAKISNTLKKHPVFQAERTNSDLLTGIYEGGLKIWECTYDLAEFIREQKIDLNNKLVLDLGCGAGIIGILALIKGSSVYFQDYNEEIIEFITIPNVYLNIKSSVEKNVVLLDKCKFYSGDWNSFLSITADNVQNENDKFDFIFSCETIYNVDSYKKLHAVFKECLKQNGTIYLAAKTYYFGVGGGLREFENFMTEQGVFYFSTCWKCSEGLQREILKITFRK